MFQVIYEYNKSWPKDGLLRVEAQFTGEIAVSPIDARRHVGGFLGGHVTMMVLPGDPVLVLGETPVWRVPAYLHLPDLGAVTTVGMIDVNALTGEIITPSTPRIAMMQQRADEIATRFTSPPTSTG